MILFIMEIEKLLNSAMTRPTEKTYIDKILSKDDSNAIRKIIRKDELTRDDMLELLYLLSGTETKLLNLTEWDRHIMLKFLVWIREFVKLSEQIFDYENDLKKKETYKSVRTQQLFKNIKRTMSHDVKFLVDLYLALVRTTLSLGGSLAFDLLKSKYEVVYPQGGQPTQAQTSNIGGRI